MEIINSITAFDIKKRATQQAALQIIKSQWI